MSEEIYRGVVQGGMVVFHDGHLSLMDGVEVVVLPIATGKGSAAAVLAAIAAAPLVPTSWVDELEALIEKGRRPATYTDPLAGGHADAERS